MVIEAKSGPQKVELTQVTKSSIPEKVASQKERLENHRAVREAFLKMDRKGRCDIGGICKEAFEELRIKCGNPKKWNQKDMQRQDIKDLVLAYRIFGILRENKPLIPEEIAFLKSLLSKQQQINTSKDSSIQKDVGLSNLPANSKLAQEVAKNQEQINTIGNALNQGILSEEQRFNSSSTAIAKWGEPGKDMSPELTASIIDLYDYSLRMTNRDRASIIFLDEPMVKSPSQEEREQRILLFGLLEQSKKARALLDEQREEDVMAKLKGLSFAPA